MKKISFMLTSVGFFIALLCVPMTAQAQIPRVFVAAVGSDSNQCGNLNRPCRTLSLALTKVQAGGEVVILDSGDYLPVVINKAVDIVAAPGVHPVLAVPSGAGIEVSAGVNDAVSIRGLKIKAQGGARGIHFNSGAVLQVESCTISGFTPLPSDCCTDGILMNAAAKLFVRKTTASGNFNGIRNFNGIVSIESSRLENNTNGLWAENEAKVTIRDSFVGGNGSGITAFINSASPSTGLTEINVENCLVAGNNSGIHATGKVGELMLLTLVRVSNSTVTHNGQGLSVGTAGSGRLFSRGNNTVEGNNVDGAFTDPFTAK